MRKIPIDFQGCGSSQKIKVKKIVAAKSKSPLKVWLHFCEVIIITRASSLNNSKVLCKRARSQDLSREK